ncbi:hypothetical protein [Stieleria sp.]|uniref:hypothetical protein n=1 Tax=Stieleria sp. TaxID=2795976 RepID=UPI003567BBEE
MRINPDFRTVDEVELAIDPQKLGGWTDGESTTESELIAKENRTIDAIQAEQPAVFQTRITDEMSPEMLAKWTEFQLSKGRHRGSNDLSLIDEFVHGKPLLWLPQIIGSCVMSNTFRIWVARLMYQIVLLGKSQEYLGRNEFGSSNYSFYGPWSYGHARKKANMRRGDGLYCAPMAWSLMQGVISCSTPALMRILSDADLDNANDFPEPQGRDGAALYRAFGNWAHVDELEPYKDFAVLESPSVKSADQLWDLLLAGKPSFVCSGEAIHKVGEHPDGFPIHARNPRDSWSHNMAFIGAFVASDGERFIRESNESWGEKHIYNRRFAEVESSFRAGRLTVQAIGEIAGLSSSPPLMG